MEELFVAIICTLILVCIAYSILNCRKFMKMSDEIEDLKLELSKVSFRLFVTEKKQRILGEQNSLKN